MQSDIIFESIFRIKTSLFFYSVTLSRFILYLVRQQLDKWKDWDGVGQPWLAARYSSSWSLSPPSPATGWVENMAKWLLVRIRRGITQLLDIGCSFLQSTSTWSDVGSFKGCKGTTCVTMVFFTGCRRIFALLPIAPLPPPSPPTLVSAGLFFSYFLTPHSCCCAAFLLS